MISQPHLQAKIKEVISHFPWYQVLLNMNTPTSEPLRIEDLPYMTADIMEKHYYNQLQDPSLNVYRTSGTSSNRRKEIYYSQEDEERYLQLKVNVLTDFLQTSNAIKIQKAVVDVGTGHAAATAVTVFQQLGLQCEQISFELPITEHVARLTLFQPDVLYTMPSILDHIIHAADDPSAFGLKKIILVGEIASEQWQENMAAIFGIARKDIFDTYGSIELGTMAYFSHQHQRYLFVEGMYAEGVQPQDIGLDIDPLAEDESILVLTSFVRTMFPSVRYVTYDVVRDLRPIIVGGSIRQSFHSIVKRVGAELKHGEKISLYDIEQVVYRYLDQASIRLKLEQNRLSVLIKSRAANDKLMRMIQKDLENQIPEIGLMIRNKILDEIRVIPISGDSDDQSFPAGQVKNKKIYYQTETDSGAST